MSTCTCLHVDDGAYVVVDPYCAQHEEARPQFGGAFGVSTRRPRIVLAERFRRTERTGAEGHFDRLKREQ